MRCSGQIKPDYSVIGDVTNVASCLDGLTQGVGYQAVCSYAVADRMESRAGRMPLGARAIKGHSAVEISGHDKIAQTVVRIGNSSATIRNNRTPNVRR